MVSPRNAAPHDDADLPIIDANGQYTDLIRWTILPASSATARSTSAIRP